MECHEEHILIGASKEADPKESRASEIERAVGLLAQPFVKLGGRPVGRIECSKGVVRPIMDSPGGLAGVVESVARAEPCMTGHQSVDRPLQGARIDLLPTPER